MRTPLTLLLLAAPCLAQIPLDAAFVFESTPLTADYYKVVDVLGRGATTVRGQSVFMPIESVALDPLSAGEFYYLGSATSLPGTWRGQMQPLADIGTNVWGPWSQNAADRIAVGDNYIATLAGTTLQVFAKVGNLPGQTFTVPLSVDVAFFGDLAYLGGDGSLGSTSISELDVATGVTRTVGTYPGIRCLAASHTGSELCVGTFTGDLVRLDAATGAVVSVVATGLSDLVAVDYTRFGTLVYSDGSALYSELVPTAPILVSATVIVDLGVARVPTASVVPFGDGCGVVAAASWASTGVPSLGNGSFALGLRDAPPQSVALFAVGQGRSVWQAAGLSLPLDLQPVGAAGCRLLVNPQVSLLLPTNANGAADQAFPIPSTPSLIGLELAAQWFVPDAAIGSFGFAATEGVAFVIG